MDSDKKKNHSKIIPINDEILKLYYIDQQSRYVEKLSPTCNQPWRKGNYVHSGDNPIKRYQYFDSIKSANCYLEKIIDSISSSRYKNISKAFDYDFFNHEKISYDVVSFKNKQGYKETFSIKSKDVYKNNFDETQLETPKIIDTEIQKYAMIEDEGTIGMFSLVKQRKINKLFSKRELLEKRDIVRRKDHNSLWYEATILSISNKLENIISTLYVEPYPSQDENLVYNTQGGFRKVLCLLVGKDQNKLESELDYLFSSMQVTPINLEDRETEKDYVDSLNILKSNMTNYKKRSNK